MSENEFRLKECSSIELNHCKALSNGFQPGSPREVEQSSDGVFNLSNKFTPTFANKLEYRSDSSINKEIDMDHVLSSPTRTSLQTIDVTDIKYPDDKGGLKLPQENKVFENHISKSLSDEFSDSDFKYNRKSLPDVFPQDYTNPNQSPSPFLIASRQGTEELDRKVLPKVCELRPQTYVAFLMENIREWSHDISLKEFYHLLHNPNSISRCPNKNSQYSKVNGKNSNHGSGRYGFEMFLYILDTFRTFCNGTSSLTLGLSKEIPLSSVKFEEFSKTFLALKIIFDSIEEVDPSLHPNHTMPRKSIYNAYCMTCKKLGERDQKYSTSSKLQSNPIVSVPHFGRLTKLVYPNLKLRRLGRRGNSKYHYLGITWRNQVVDVETIKSLEVNIKGPCILRTIANETATPYTSKPELLPVIKTPIASHVEGISASNYTFIRTSCKFPEFGCSPRVWNSVPGKLPENSESSRDIISKSMLALQRYGVDMQPIIQNINCEIFHSVSPNVFLAYSIERMNILINGISNREGYMNFYLIILLLLFPIILSSDTEVCLEDKEKLRKNLIWFVGQLKAAIPNLPKNERGHFINFSNIIRKMVHVNELTSSRVKTSLTKGITEEIAVDIQKTVNSELGFCEKTVAEVIISRAVIICSKAFNTAFVLNNNRKSTIDNKSFTSNIIESTIKFMAITTESLSTISKSMSLSEVHCSTFDLPFQFFRHSAEIFHKTCLLDPFILKLPIQVLNLIVSFIHNELHGVSFDKFGKRDHELSKNTFKTWWVYSTLAQEYMKILSEIVGLSEQLV